MKKRIRVDHPWYEIAVAQVHKARAPRDCHMAEHKDGWEGAIQKGDTYIYLRHAHLNCCALHFDEADVEDAP